MTKDKIKNIYQENGGIRIGDSYWFSLNYTWPLASISVSKKNILLAYNSSKIEFKKKEVKYIEKYRGLFSKGIRIYHKRKNNPFIVFWSYSVDDLIQKLRDVGYKVKGKNR